MRRSKAAKVGGGREGANTFKALKICSTPETFQLSVPITVRITFEIILNFTSAPIWTKVSAKLVTALLETCPRDETPFQGEGQENVFHCEKPVPSHDPFTLRFRIFQWWLKKATLSEKKKKKTPFFLPLNQYSISLKN